MRLAVGTYSGNATDNRAITGLGFQTSWVLVKRTDATGDGVYSRSSTMPTNNSSHFTAANNLVTDAIKTLDSDGFTIGVNGAVNASGISYAYAGFGTDANSQLTAGSYSGNDTDSRAITGVGFAPDMVYIVPGTAQSRVWRPSTLAGDNSLVLPSGTAANLIQTLDSDGFTLGNDARVNVSPNIYHYVAFRLVTNGLETNSYTGNGVDARSISIGFQPIFTMIQDSTTTTNICVGRFGVSGDSSGAMSDAAWTTDIIQAFNSNGFEVGLAATVNTDTDTYHAFSALDNPLAGGRSGLQSKIW